MIRLPQHYEQEFPYKYLWSMSTDKGLDNRNCQSNLRILLFTCIWVSNWCHGKSAAIIIYFDCGFLDKIYIDNFIPWKFGIAHLFTMSVVIKFVFMLILKVYLQLLNCFYDPTFSKQYVAGNHLKKAASYCRISLSYWFYNLIGLGKGISSPRFLQALSRDLVKN